MRAIAGRSLAVLALAAAFCAPAGAASYAKGVDVSNWNGSIDWLQVGNDGYTFVFAKATESTTFTDVTYAINRAGAQGVGLRLGAYHFARPSGSSDAAVVSSAIAQADYFVNVSQPRAGDLPPVLDLEQRGGLSAARLVQWTQAWLDEVAARTGLRALVYTSPSFWKTSLGDTPVFAGNGYRLWIAHWTKAAAPLVPASNWGGLGWSFWQWTDCEQVPGFAHCSDGNRVNGPSPVPFALPAYPGGAPAPSAPPTVVGAPKAGAMLAAVPGTWNGGKPVAFSYQWQSCDAAGGTCTPIPGATLATYTPTGADVGHALVLGVTAVSARGTATAVSPATAPVAPAGAGGAARPAVLTAPLVSGTTQVGQVLTANAGTWSGSPTTLAFQWRRCDSAGAGCTAISGATGSTYTPTPGDIGSTLSLVVTATGKGGSQSATAVTTAAVVAAPVPAAVFGPLAAQPGLAGAVATDDSRATVTWQPGAVPTGTTVAVAPVDTAPLIQGTGVSLALTPPQATLPWPVDVAYAAAPAGQVVGFSPDGKMWIPVAPLTTPALSGGLDQGSYTVDGVLHVLTRQAGQIALFRAGRWGDPKQISPRAPVVRVQTPPRLIRQRDGSILVLARLSTSSQAHVYLAPLTARTTILRRSRVAGVAGAQALVYRSGGFPVRLQLTTRSRVVKIRVRAVDPWGRQGAYTWSLRVP